MLKNWLKSPSGEKFIIFIANTYMSILFKTIKWTSKDHGGKAWIDQGEVAILVNWHSRLLGPMVMLGRKYPSAYIISPSRDGRLISRIAASFGIETIWGSNSQKAISGYREMCRRLSSGRHVGITPDGPRGPAQKAAPGAITLAKTSGKALIPIAWSTSRMKRMSSWDRLALPGFFSKGITLWGKPIIIPKNADDAAVAEARIALEDALNDLTTEADTYFGHPADHAENSYNKKKEKR